MLYKKQLIYSHPVIWNRSSSPTLLWGVGLRHREVKSLAKVEPGQSVCSFRTHLCFCFASGAEAACLMYAFLAPLLQATEHPSSFFRIQLSPFLSLPEGIVHLSSLPRQPVPTLLSSSRVIATSGHTSPSWTLNPPGKSCLTQFVFPAWDIKDSTWQTLSKCLLAE